MKAKRFLFLMSTLFIILAIAHEPSLSILKNLWNLIDGSDILITDYFVVGSKAAAFLNAGLVGYLSCFLIYKTKPEISGVLIASVFLMIGFALFGKNILNVWPIIFGTYIYARSTNVKLGSLLHISFFATSIAPIVSEILFMMGLPLYIALPFSIVVGASIGYLIVPVSKHLHIVHKGYNLYNIGFGVGILSTLYVSLMRSYGHYAQNHVLWSMDKNYYLYGFFFLFFGLMMAYGYAYDRSFTNQIKLMKTSGYMDNDYYDVFGIHTIMINMGLNGLVCLIYLLLIKAPLNGPVLGAVLTVVGFGASGKHVLTILPIFFGVFLGSLTKTWSIDNPSIIFAALFGTALSPIAGEFGFIWGALASFINSSVVLNSGFLHAGLNLYNTGFSSGLVAAVLVPLLEMLRAKEIYREKYFITPDKVVDFIVNGSQQQ